MCSKELNEDIKIVKLGEEYNFDDIIIKVVDAYNTPEGHSKRKLHHKGNGVGYLITIGDKIIYHAGDTDFIQEMKEFDHVDLAIIPIGGTFTMDIPEAAYAVLAINPKVVIPMHMKDSDPIEFKKMIEERSNIDFKSLEIGEVYKLEN